MFPVFSVLTSVLSIHMTGWLCSANHSPLSEWQVCDLAEDEDVTEKSWCWPTWPRNASHGHADLTLNIEG